MVDIPRQPLPRRGGQAPARYENTTLGRQELEGEYLEDVEGALWTAKLIQANRLQEAGEMSRVVVAVDPPGGATMHIPHGKAQNAGGRQSYITYIDMENRKSTRKGFISRSAYEPDFKLSESGKLLGIVSMGNRFLEIHVYDFESANMLKRFELSYRLFEKDDSGVVMGDSRTSFDFLPGGDSVLMTMGNRLILWDMELNK
ncbi:MAG: hypothetical protein U5Q03_14865 [Bacteroidota bacterium]|nr:hypothetical protein [Bacteroidota bacterium]